MKYLLGGENEKVYLNSKMLNRHGIIAGATGTGKTVTLKVISEMLNNDGINTFITDVKGDIMSLAENGERNDKIDERLAKLGIDDYQVDSFPVEIFDIYKKGVPLRASVTDIGPVLLSKMLGLNDVQSGVIDVMYKIADENGLKLIDFKDLKIMLKYMADFSSDISNKYGNVAKQSINAIQRTLIRFENEGAIDFFGEPSFDIHDLLQTEGGKGIMNVLAADKLMMQPKLYSTFLLWLISELYATLPEVGDQPLPKLVFFFDEAHMLFEGTSKALIDKIEQVIRLIRSKGVGIYLITQSPTDIPLSILGQLGNRVQHALRAYTPKDQKAVKSAAETFRTNPAFKTEEAITNLETGEALVSFLDEKGAPQMVERAKMLFPLSQIGAITDEQRKAIIAQSSLGRKYDQPFDRESAYEQLLKMEQQAQQETPVEEEKSARKATTSKGNSLFSKVLKSVITALTATFASVLGTAVSNQVTGKKSRSRKTATERAVKNATSAATRTMTREITRSILGNIVK